MMYNIHMGIPELQEFWESLSDRVKNKSPTNSAGDSGGGCAAER